MYAYQGNLADPEDPGPAAFAGPEFFGFDVAAVGLGFHHFDNPGYAAKQLAARLRPGGVLFVLEFLPHAPVGQDGGGHDHVHDHGHDHSHGNGGGHDHGDAHDHGHSHSHSHAAVDNQALESQPTVTHHGFSEEQIRTIFEEAGVGKDFALAEIGGGVVFAAKGGPGMRRRVFIARGVKV